MNNRYNILHSEKRKERKYHECEVGFEPTTLRLSK